jgi:hypothetical protein
MGCLHGSQDPPMQTRVCLPVDPRRHWSRRTWLMLARCLHPLRSCAWRMEWARQRASARAGAGRGRRAGGRARARCHGRAAVRVRRPGGRPGAGVGGRGAAGRRAGARRRGARAGAAAHAAARRAQVQPRGAGCAAAQPPPPHPPPAARPRGSSLPRGAAALRCLGAQAAMRCQMRQPIPERGPPWLWGPRYPLCHRSSIGILLACAEPQCLVEALLEQPF